MPQSNPPRRPELSCLSQHLQKVLDGFRAAVGRKHQRNADASLGGTVKRNGDKSNPLARWFTRQDRQPGW